MIVELNRKQKKVIRSIVRIQLESLKAILIEDCGEDIELYCIENEVSKGKLKLMVEMNVRDFEYIYENPEHFLTLEDSHLSMIKHILHIHKWNENIIEAKTQVWRKLVLNEQFIYNPQ